MSVKVCKQVITKTYDSGDPEDITTGHTHQCLHVDGKMFTD
jgi:hypothetical protein